jgi:hypothetical protein
MDMQTFKADGGTGARLTRLCSLFCLGLACGILAASLIAPENGALFARPLASIEGVSAR